MKSKAGLREEFRKLRRNLDQNYKREAHKKILAEFQEFLSEQKASNLIVGAYWPLKDEFDVLPLLRSLVSQHIICALPKLKDKELEFREWMPQTKLVPNIFNILEPEDSKVIEPNVIIVPYVACDKKCNRLGYGKGYYDKFLSVHRSTVKSIALCYTRQMANFILPCDPHDQKVDLVITEERIYFSN